MTATDTGIDQFLQTFAATIGVPRIGQRHVARKYAELAHMKGVPPEAAGALYLHEHPPRPPEPPTLHDVVAVDVPYDELRAALTHPELLAAGGIRRTVGWDGREWCVTGFDGAKDTFTLWELFLHDGWTMVPGAFVGGQRIQTPAQRVARGGVVSADNPTGLRVSCGDGEWVVGAVRIVVKGESLWRRTTKTNWWHSTTAIAGKCCRPCARRRTC
jgi:hypothetical protein